MPSGLVRRSGRYSLRRRVPLDLVEHYGRAEITKALGTADPSEARIKLVREWAALDREFAHVRVLKAEPTTKPVQAQQAEIDIDAYAERALGGLRRKRARYAAEGKLSLFVEESKDSLATYEAALTGPEDFGFSLEVAEGMRNALKAVLEGSSVGPPSSSGAGRKGGAIARTTLAQVAHKWAEERKPSARTVLAMNRLVSRFESSSGGIAVADISKAHVLAFKDNLLGSGQSAANINVLLTRLSTLLNFAANNLLISTNPASGVRVVDKRKAKDKRREFDADALRALFQTPVFASGVRPSAGGGDAAYWLPILALYTGARQTELGQLHPDDIMSEPYEDADGNEQSAWVMRFVENEARGQTVKNEASQRRVPIHSALVGLGFLEFVRAAKRSGSARLFPDIQPSAQGELMGNWSKWFGRYLRSEAGVTDARVVFHSFRHSFKHYARLSNMQTTALNEITGHETGDVADAYGGLSYPLAPLVEAMSLYRAPHIELLIQAKAKI